jgi:hypothetical protein
MRSWEVGCLQAEERHMSTMGREKADKEKDGRKEGENHREGLEKARP